jgi:hypothetical protein
MTSFRTRDLLCSIAAAASLALLLAFPAAAECTAQTNAFPDFSAVAPTARTIVVGTVGGDFHGFAESARFDLAVSDVVRGDAPSVMAIAGLRSGLPLDGSPVCRQNAHLYARSGNVIALALGGRLAGTSGPVNGVAWIEGTFPSGVLMPHPQRLTLDTVRRLASLPSTDSSTTGTRPSDGAVWWIASSLIGGCLGVVLVTRHRRKSAVSGRRSSAAV